MGLPPELEFVFGDSASVFEKVQVLRREMIAENTLALTLERPEHFSFQPGQYTAISIPGKHADDVREFSIASAPHEKELVIAMRVRGSNFKNTCYVLQTGESVSVRKAAGSLWEESEKPQVWLSGGIGITPFRGVLRHLVHVHSSVPVVHFHSDRTHASTPFAREFRKYTEEHETYRFVPTYTEESMGPGHHGRLTASVISSGAQDYRNSSFFLAGSDSFTTAMRKELSELGVALDDIRTERFEGYSSH